jgi:hypothetical protein
MRKAITKSIPFAAWMLCALIVSACLDAAPDPPAVRPHGIEAAARCLGDLESPAVQSLRSHSCFADPRIEVRWTAARLVFTAKRPVDLVAVVRRSADTSPPTFFA